MRWRRKSPPVEPLQINYKVWVKAPLMKPLPNGMNVAELPCGCHVNLIMLACRDCSEHGWLPR